MAQLRQPWRLPAAANLDDYTFAPVGKADTYRFQLARLAPMVTGIALLIMSFLFQLTSGNTLLPALWFIIFSGICIALRTLLFGKSWHRPLPAMLCMLIVDALALLLMVVTHSAVASTLVVISIAAAWAGATKRS